MGVNTVADAYYELVKVNKRSIKQIPSEVRAEVQVRIDADSNEQQPPSEA